MSDICKLFNVSDNIVDANGQPTLFVQSLIEMQNEYYSIVQRQCTDYTSLVVPQDYIDSRKANAKRLSEEFKKLTIPVKIFGGYRGTSRIKLETLFSLNVPIFYGLKEQDDQLRNAENIFSILFDDSMIITQYNEYSNTFTTNGKKGIMFIRVASNNLKYMQYCKNAKPIADFKAKYIYRKADMVTEYFQAQNFVNKYNNLPEFYRSKGFRKMAPAWAKRINPLVKLIEKLNKNNKGSWERYRYELSKWFDLNNIELSKEQKAFVKTIEDMQEMVEANEQTMRYLNVPYRLDESDHSTFWNIAKTVLAY
jgi:hypothetical protein